MKYLLLLGLVTLTGAGCRSTSGLPPALVDQNPAANNRTTLTPNDPLCTGAATENEAGAAVYPIAQKYDRFPRLGQIFTALDCGNRDRALQVQGFQGDKYRAGIMLRWSVGAPPAEFEAALKRLGFIEETKGAWATREPLSLEDLMTLQPFFLDKEKNGGLENEDCLACG